MRFIYIPLIFIVLLMATITPEASKFRLKNVPEQYALIEGAVVKKDSQTIVIMTETGLSTRSLDSIEILEETPEADKTFIETHGPNNQEYQRYLNPVKTQSSGEAKTQETYGYQSIAKPGEMYELRYKFEKGKLTYCLMDIDMTMEAEVEGRTIPVTTNMQAVMQMLVRKIDRSGNAEIFIQIEPKSGEVGMAGFKQKMPRSALGEKQSMTLTISPTGDLISGDIPGAESSLLPVPDITGGSTFSISNTLPKNKVAVGDRWKGNIQSRIEAENSAMDMNCVLKDIVDIEGKRAAVIETAITGKVNSVEFDPKNALPIGSSLLLGSVKPTMNMTITRTVTEFLDLDTQQSLMQKEIMEADIEMLDAEKKPLSKMKMKSNTNYTFTGKKPR